MRLLADHPDVFDKEITEVYTFPEGSLPELEHFHMVFRLEKKGTGKREEMTEEKTSEGLKQGGDMAILTKGVEEI
jgi:hypothetical protein